MTHHTSSDDGEAIRRCVRGIARAHRFLIAGEAPGIGGLTFDANAHGSCLVTFQLYRLSHGCPTERAMKSATLAHLARCIRSEVRDVAVEDGPGLSLIIRYAPIPAEVTR